MGLPSIKPTYLFLARIPLDVIHECLKLRLEQKVSDPSLLSLKQVLQFFCITVYTDGYLMQKLISDQAHN